MWFFRSLTLCRKLLVLMCSLPFTLHHLHLGDSGRLAWVSLFHPLCCSAVFNSSLEGNIPISSRSLPLPRFNTLDPHFPSLNPQLDPCFTPWLHFMPLSPLVIMFQLPGASVSWTHQSHSALELFPLYSVCLESSFSKPSCNWLLPTTPKSLNPLLGSVSTD